MNRQVNSAGIDLIKASEGCSLKAYPDPASPLAAQLRKPENARRSDWMTLSGAPWTIGFGATGLDPYNRDAAGNPTPIGPKTEWTQEQADERLKSHVAEFAVGVEKLISQDANHYLSDNQFAALVSFAYNVGINNLKNSTLLKLVNAKRYDAAANEFLKWTKAQGQVLPGLVKRRENERRLFLTR